LDDACAEVAIAVSQSCPADSTYIKKNDYIKCVRMALRQAMWPYKHCFTREEEKLIRDCAADELGIGRDEEDEPQIRDEPPDLKNQIN
jgi:hypothetical protein